MSARPLAGDVEGLAVLKHRLVPIGRCVAERQACPLGQLHAAEFGILGGDPPQVNDGRLKAQRLLDEIAQQLGIVAHPLHGAGTLKQQHQCRADGVGGGLVTAGEQLVEQILQLVHVEAPLLAWAAALIDHPGVGQVGNDVVSGLAPPLLNDAGEEALRLHHQLAALEGLSLVNEAAAGCQHGVGPCLKLPNLLPGHAELVGDDRAGQGDGEVADEIAFPAVNEGVDEVVDHRFHVGRHGADALHGEGVVDELAVL